MCCGAVAAIVLSDSAAYLTGCVMLHQRLHLKNKQKQKHAGTQTGVQDRPTLPSIFCDVIMSATSIGRVCSARAQLKIPKEQKKLDTFNPSTKPR